MNFTFGDLFCGAGGTSRGFVRAGGVSKFGIDLNRVQSGVYRGNFGHCHNARVQDLSVSDILALPSINLLAASPPCQGYSVARRGNLPERKDKAVGLDILPYVVAKKPEFIFLENVRPYAKSPVFDAICNSLRSLKYFVEWKVCDFSYWGVPQRRIRTVLLASNQKSFQFPCRQEKPKGWMDGITAEMILRCKEAKFTKHQLNRLPPNLRPMCLLEREGANDDRALQHRYMHEPAFTIKALGHDRHWRQMDIWTGEKLYGVSIEIARKLQGFPDEHLLPIDNQLAWYGIGNSVPPLFTEKLISDFLESFA